MLIQFRGVTKVFGRAQPAVNDLNLQLNPGELTALVGESGCGKSTTLKLTNRLIEPTSGQITIDGADISQLDPVKLRRQIGYVFQSGGLFPHMSVAENIGIPLHITNRPDEEIAARTDELLTLINLDADRFRSRLPGELSGGQRQRAAFARALAASPTILLLDEPFGALDPITRDKLQMEFREIHDRLSLTSVIVTHDMAEALLIADRIVVMRQGRIVRDGAPRELLADPGDEYVAGLLDTPVRQARQVTELAENPASP